MKKIYIVVGVVGVLLVVLFSHKGAPEDRVPLDGASVSVTLTGTYVCLPFIETRMPASSECVFGLLTDGGVYYMVNLGQSASMKEQFDQRARITAEGFVVPKEALSTDHWVPYNMKGIFTIKKILK